MTLKMGVKAKKNCQDHKKIMINDKLKKLKNIKNWKNEVIWSKFNFGGPPAPSFDGN